MSKIAIVTDTHFGARGDNQHLLQKQISFFRDQFFPELERRGIEQIMHIGDFFDKRKNINISTLNSIAPILEMFSQYTTHVVIGNHDVYYNNKNTVNSVSEILLQNQNFNSDNLKVYISTEDIEIFGTSVLVIPWINRENNEHSLRTIAKSTAKYAFGHLEINGFELHHGVYCQGKQEKITFSKFDTVFSGHFHKQSKKDNIHYVGTPYHLNWGEYGNDVGFHILDLVTGELEFIPTKLHTLVKLVYSGEENFEIDEDHIKGCFVRLVNDKPESNIERFNALRKRIDAIGVAELRVVEARAVENTRVDLGDLYATGKRSTIDFLVQYVDKQENLSDDEKSFIKKEVVDLYNQAKTLS
jgi:DNA repair exonuclease SbcCD nuclease subunit